MYFTECSSVAANYNTETQIEMRDGTVEHFPGLLGAGDEDFGGTDEDLVILLSFLLCSCSLEGSECGGSMVTMRASLALRLGSLLGSALLGGGTTTWLLTWKLEQACWSWRGILGGHYWIRLTA